MIRKEELIELISRILNVSLYDKQYSNWNEIGIDSISYVKLLVYLEEELEIEFEEYFLDSQNFDCFDEFINKVLDVGNQARGTYE